MNGADEDDAGMNDADMNDAGMNDAGMNDAKRERLLEALRVELARRREDSPGAPSIEPDLDLERIAAYLDGDLFDAEARALERDLAIDPRLRRLVEELRTTEADPVSSPGAAGAGRAWRQLGLPIGILAVAASVVLAALIWRPSSPSGPRIIEVPQASRVVACRGEVVRVAGPGDVSASVEVGDLLATASRVSLGPEARLEVFREDGVYELAEESWRAVAPSFGVTDRFLGERLELPVSKGETRSGMSEARPIRPVCTVLPVRPSFEWSGEVGEGARLVVDRIEGVVFSAEILGDSFTLPEDETSLERDVGYRWRIEDARGSIVFRQTFTVASEAEVDQWRSRSEAVRASSVSADVEDLLLALLAKEAGLCEQAKAAATRLADRGSFEALRMLASQLDDSGRLRADVVDLLSAWDKPTNGDGLRDE